MCFYTFLDAILTTTDHHHKIAEIICSSYALYTFCSSLESVIAKYILRRIEFQARLVVQEGVEIECPQWIHATVNATEI